MIGFIRFSPLWVDEYLPDLFFISITINRKHHHNHRRHYHDFDDDDDDDEGSHGEMSDRPSSESSMLSH